MLQKGCNFYFLWKCPHKGDCNVVVIGAASPCPADTTRLQSSERFFGDGVNYVNIPISPTSKRQLHYMELDLQDLQEPTAAVRGNDSSRLPTAANRAKGIHYHPPLLYPITVITFPVSYLNGNLFNVVCRLRLVYVDHFRGKNKNSVWRFRFCLATSITFTWHQPDVFEQNVKTESLWKQLRR